MNTCLPFTAAALLLGGVAAPSMAVDTTQSTGAARTTGSATVGTFTPQQFVTQAAEGGLAEVQLSELARQQAGAALVRQFAERMIDDHTKANAELEAIARQKGLTLPKQLNAEHRATLKTLQQMQGAEFDAAYMAAMKRDHIKTIALFQAANGPAFTDPELKTFASKTLPILEQHHKLAEQTDAGVRATTR